jgi:hypothetical protein
MASFWRHTCACGTSRRMLPVGLGYSKPPRESRAFSRADYLVERAHQTGRNIELSLAVQRSELKGRKSGRWR